MPGLDTAGVVLSRAYARLRGIERQLEAHRDRLADSTSAAGVELLVRALLVLVAELERRLLNEARAVDAYSPPPAPKTVAPADGQKPRVVPIEPRLTAFTGELDALEAHLVERFDLLTHVPSPDFDALIDPFTRLAGELPGERRLELLFQPLAKYRYEVWPDVLAGLADFAQINDELGQFFDEAPRLLAVHYPLANEGETFMHALLAHEIAHIALDHGEVGDEIFLAAVSEAGKDRDVYFDYREWFHELACDLLAVRAIGPAYAIALAEHALTDNVWFHQRGSVGFRSHPGVPWRLAVLEREVRRFIPTVPRDAPKELGAVWRKVRTAVREWGSAIGEMPSDAYDERKVIEAALKTVARRASGILGNAVYPCERFQADLPAVWAKLEDGIAPAEAVYGRDRARPDGVEPSAWSEPMDWRSVLNGGYLHWLTGAVPDRLPTLRGHGRELDDSRRAAARHVQGSIELSELHRRMASMRAQMSGLAGTGQGRGVHAGA